MCVHIFVGQNFGQNSGFREIFDVAVARAVAEMRVLGKYNIILFSKTSIIPILIAVIMIVD